MNTSSLWSRRTAVHELFTGAIGTALLGVALWRRRGAGLEAARADVRRVLEEAAAADRAALGSVEAKIAGDVHAAFDGARRRVPGLVDELAGFGACVDVVKKMVVDSFRKTATAEEFLRGRFEAALMPGYAEARAAMEAPVATFATDLETSLATCIGRLPAGALQAGAQEDSLLLANFSAAVAHGSETAEKVAADTVASSSYLAFAVISTALSRRVISVLGGIARKFAGRVAAALPLVLADGPLPFGDALMVALDAVFVGIAAADLYDAQVVLKGQLGSDIEQALAGQEGELIAAGTGRVRSLAEIADKGRREALGRVLAKQA